MIGVDIREQTYLIIRKNRLFLQGKEWITGEPLWTQYTYNAWRTKEREQAEEVARKLGGVRVLFNPVTGKKKVIGA